MSSRSRVEVTRVAVLADDLIWQLRLAEAAQSAGATTLRVRSIAALERELDRVEAVIVDLTARKYDPLLALEAVAGRSLRVLAVGQHDDHELRKRALAAGAERVYAYRKLFEDGGATLSAWLSTVPPAAPAATSRAR